MNAYRRFFLIIIKNLATGGPPPHTHLARLKLVSGIVTFLLSSPAVSSFIEDFF